MAVWHLLFTLPVLAFFVLYLVSASPPQEGQGDSYGMMILAGAVLTGGGILSTLLLGVVSLALLGKSFFSPPWKVIIVPGLLGTLAAILGAFVGWPTSEVIGGFVAYHLVSESLTQSHERATT